MQTDTGTTHWSQKAHAVATPRIRFHLDMASVWAEEVWLAPRPGIKVRELYQSDDGYRISLIRYAPGAKVPEHLHSADEHTHVIEGSICDAQGTYGPGAYLLSPAGSRHRVWSDKGSLVITHRLGPIRFSSGWRPGPGLALERNAAPAERPSIILDTGISRESAWEELCEGVYIMSLFEGPPGNYKAALVRFRPGSSIPLHVHMGDEHGYILSGCQEDEYGSYETGGYVYNPIGTSHRVWSEEGCLALVHWRGPMRYL